MSKLPEPFATVRQYPAGAHMVMVVGLDTLPDGTKLFTEAQLLTAVGEAIHEVMGAQAVLWPSPAKPEVAPLPAAVFTVSTFAGRADAWSEPQVLAVQADAYAVGYKRAKMDVDEQAAADKTLAETKASSTQEATLPAVARALEGMLTMFEKGYTEDRTAYVRGAIARVRELANKV